MRRALALAALAIGLVAPAASAQSAPDAGQAFDPAPVSKPLYGSKPPSEDPERQRHFVKAADGVDLFVETWLPAAKDGNTPPERVPVVLVMTPYVKQGVEEYPGFAELLNSYGYAVAQHHVRGTGESGGCLEQTAASQIDDGARVVEYLGRDAGYSDANVGMYGISYDAETQISVAGFGDPDKIRYLKAIVPLASVGGQYEYSFFDGVPFAGFALTSNAFYLGGVSLMPGDTSSPAQYVQKLQCQPEVLSSSADQNGDMTPFWAAREYRPGASRVTAATLYVHGLVDWNVQPLTTAGWFDRLPDSTPHKGLFGVWNHAFPSSHQSVHPEWERTDWDAMVVAWFDRYLKNLPSGVEAWPEVQVQDSSGQWRGEREFPATGGPPGQLALGPDGKLGGDVPDGVTGYREGVDEAVFETAAVGSPLHITGQPVLDLWLSTDNGDGHVAAKLEVVDADGVGTYGMRSVQHRESLPDNRFAQAAGEPAPAGEPFNLIVRFYPNDIVVPAGGKLRLTVAGAISYAGRDSQPSGSAAAITIHHDCGLTSALRFAMATPGAPLLNAREADDPEALASAPEAQPLHDGGGVASATVCGRPPLSPDMLGRTWSQGVPGPKPKGDPPATCVDTVAPRVRKASLRGGVLRGRASDGGCGARVARVEVSVARRAGKRCRHMVGRARFSAPRPCAVRAWLAPRGTKRFALRLPRGRYTVRVRAVDATGNVSRVRALRKA